MCRAFTGAAAVQPLTQHVMADTDFSYMYTNNSLPLNVSRARCVAGWSVQYAGVFGWCFRERLQHTARFIVLRVTRALQHLLAAIGVARNADALHLHDAEHAARDRIIR